MVEVSEAFATRVSTEEAERINAALEQTGQSRSDLVGNALRYYTRENPDNISAFRPESGHDPLENGIYDPTTEWSYVG